LALFTGQNGKPSATKVAREPDTRQLGHACLDLWRRDHRGYPRVFDAIADNGAVVPALWRLEVANSLTMAVRRRRIDPDFGRAALADLALLDITTDQQTDSYAWTDMRLPPYAPELNPIENVWEYLRGNKLAITVFDDYDDILDKTCDAWNFFEQDPKRIASITTRTWATVNN